MTNAAKWQWTSIELPRTDAVPERVHVFEPESIMAVRAAMAARRPLLVRGEPGVGKSQLAEAVALQLERPFISFVVDSRTESQQLMWDFDAVMRLADAQLLGALGAWYVGDERQLADGGDDSVTTTPPSRSRHQVAKTREWLGEELHLERYVRPGPLWWAFHWESAQQQAVKSRSEVRRPQPRTDPKNGCVVLIDEIDKAETHVPNGLLEALGAGQFCPTGWQIPVTAEGEPPLVVITSNEERSLPDAFMRRCVVLNLVLPEKTDRDLILHLVDRAKAHFPDFPDHEIAIGDEKRTVLEEAARQLVQDRRKARENQTRPLPGQAEYLDLVRALNEIADSGTDFRDLIKTLSKYIFRKHPDGAQWLDR